MPNYLFDRGRKLSCSIKFDVSPGNTHISQILAGYKLLEKQGILKIESAQPCIAFRSSGNYEHNSIVEVEVGGKVIAYDMADGYQSIHRFDVLDKELERLDFYFKRSCDSKRHTGMKNADKIKPLGLNYLCSCKGNPYDDFVADGHSLGELKRYLVYLKTKKNNIYDYSIFESNGRHYDDYKLLFLTRLWDSSGISAQNIKRTYPYFTDAQAAEEADKWKASLDKATKDRIEYAKALREVYADKVIAGVSADLFSQKLCPELIVDSSFTERRRYLDEIKKNYICITSEGLHQSIGWKFAEFIAAGKSIITEPLAYETVGGLEENRNYLSYNDTKSLLAACDRLMNDFDAVHAMESHNGEYYKSHLRPDKVVLDSLNTVFDVF